MNNFPLCVKIVCFVIDCEFLPYDKKGYIKNGGAKLLKVLNKNAKTDDEFHQFVQNETADYPELESLFYKARELISKLQEKENIDNEIQKAKKCFIAERKMFKEYNAWTKHLQKDFEKNFDIISKSLK